MDNFLAHILVVDDDEGIRSLVKKYLNEKKYLVTTADNAENASKKIEIIKFDLIILDIMMPGKSGLEFLEDHKNNIENRTKNMIDNGLVEEINRINNPSKTVLQAIGMNLSDSLEENINMKTKRLAKKQITWFKKESKLQMIETEDEDRVYNSLMEIINV